METSAMMGTAEGKAHSESGDGVSPMGKALLQITPERDSPSLAARIARVLPIQSSGEASLH